MASGTGYDGPLTPSVSHFDKGQRARLEALTFARKMTSHKDIEGREPTLRDWLQIADYIVRGPS